MLVCFRFSFGVDLAAPDITFAGSERVQMFVGHVTGVTSSTNVPYLNSTTKPRCFKAMASVGLNCILYRVENTDTSVSVFYNEYLDSSAKYISASSNLVSASMSEHVFSCLCSYCQLH